MPRVLIMAGWRLFFYANEGPEPIHVHCRKGDRVSIGSIVTVLIWPKPTATTFLHGSLGFTIQRAVSTRGA